MLLVSRAPRPLFLPFPCSPHLSHVWGEEGRLEGRTANGVVAVTASLCAPTLFKEAVRSKRDVRFKSSAPNNSLLFFFFLRLTIKTKNK